MLSQAKGGGPSIIVITTVYLRPQAILPDCGSPIRTRCTEVVVDASRCSSSRRLLRRGQRERRRREAVRQPDGHRLWREGQPHPGQCSAFGRGRAVAQELAQDLLEGVPELPGEHGVDEGVDGRVAVAQPEDDGEGERGDAFVAEGRDQVHGEEGAPAANEAANDDSQGLGGLRLHPEATDLSLDVALPELCRSCGHGGVGAQGVDRR